MNKKYYFKNIHWGVLFLAIFIFTYWEDMCNMYPKLVLVILSAILFPFSKWLIESLALRFTSREFWYKGIFRETAGKNGLYALYYLFCFVFSIPLGIASLTYLLLKK
ncbi:colicin E1 family microcin immunity protein [Orbus sturtevantii]|uniref:colicin E1 family microcin immunity protein n=1 Tax=Orbus sturtevantii TaxID=3074109 RepID=UPI00370D8C10